MIKLFLNTTDDFLCKSVKGIFERAESAYKSKGLEVNLKEELNKLELNPFVCTIGNNSSFEKNIKIKIKIVLGMFFVAIPLMAFILLTHMLSIDYIYAVLSTLVVAIMVSYRMDTIAKRYVSRRCLFV